MARTIVFADSRGSFLGSMISDLFPNKDITVYSYPGARLSKLVMKSVEVIYAKKPSLVIYLGGVNDLTQLDRRTRRVSLRYPTTSKFKALLSTVMMSARSLFALEFPNLVITFGGLIGLDMSRYNELPCSEEDQRFINNTVIEANRMIRIYNRLEGAPHVYFSSKVHRWIKGVSEHHYEHLIDGLHPDCIVLKHWAHQILKLHNEAKVKHA